MSLQHVHDKICMQYESLHSWYSLKISNLDIPIYSSYDVRDAGFKIGIVDGNIFPAGFNNICPTDREGASTLFKSYLLKHYPSSLKRILLVTEEHTQNSYYWENVVTIKDLLESSGYEIRVGIPRELNEPLEMETVSGKKVMVYSANENSESTQNFQPELIISNNDFSDPKEDWAKSIALPINPPRELGWYQRKKSVFFDFYNELVGEFCRIADLDPFLFNVKTERFVDFDVSNNEKVEKIAARIDLMIDQLRKDYSDRGLNQMPFVFVKNNSGTYGLGVIKVNSGDEFKTLNYKSRKKMKASKGGRGIEEVVIQEGIPSVVKAEGATAEPVIYMIGEHLAGGFFRAHSDKSDSESLNSPGAVFKRMCTSDLAIRRSECPHENVYGWVSKLALLAIGLEGKLMSVNYKNYRR